MSRNYKFQNPEGWYFVSFATVFWLSVFTRRIYKDCIVKHLKFCIEEKGMVLGAWIVMSNHVHLIFRAKENNPSDLIKSLKVYTSKQLQKNIENNIQESRKEWLLWMMERAGSKNSNVKKRQFWQQHNKPIELWSAKVIDQKLDYIHNNPVEAGFVREPQDWKYSSAIDYSGGKGILDISFL